MENSSDDKSSALADLFDREGISMDTLNRLMSAHKAVDLVVAALRAYTPSAGGTRELVNDDFPEMGARIPSHALRSEPVAWRYRYSGMESWRYVERESDCNPHEQYERQALYAAPCAGSATASTEQGSEATALLYLLGQCAPIQRWQEYRDRGEERIPCYIAVETAEKIAEFFAVAPPESRK